MKLYATTTSERASKGQGGNEFLTHVATINENVVIKYSITSDGLINLYLGDSHYTATFYDLAKTRRSNTS